MPTISPNTVLPLLPFTHAQLAAAREIMPSATIRRVETAFCRLAVLLDPVNDTTARTLLHNLNEGVALVGPGLLESTGADPELGTMRDIRDDLGIFLAVWPLIPFDDEMKPDVNGDDRVRLVLLRTRKKRM